VADPRDDHLVHDLELVARSASGDLVASEAIAARDLLAACPSCSALAADLRSIAAATRALPDAAARSAYLRPVRDFRLSEADAARLRPRGLFGLRRRLAAFGAGLDTGLGFRTRGLGGALATLGLVGLLVSAGVPALMPATGGAAQQEVGAEPPIDALGTPARAPAASLYALSSADHAGWATSKVRDGASTPAAPWMAVMGGSIIVATAGLVLLAIGLRSRRSWP
jgi:hypothetical protein